MVRIEVIDMARSKKYSFDGWNLGEYLVGRKKMIITIVGAIMGWIATQNPALTAITAAATELIVAVIEYYVKQY